MHLIVQLKRNNSCVVNNLFTFFLPSLNIYAYYIFYWNNAEFTYMCNKSIICGVLFASGALTFYEGNNMSYWLSFCHLIFRKIWYCLIKTRIDLVWLSFSFNVIKQLVFCIGQYEFLWTLEINIHLSLKASVNIVFKIHKNSYWPQPKTIIV